jgi:hypothetical protein
VSWQYESPETVSWHERMEGWMVGCRWMNGDGWMNESGVRECLGGGHLMQHSQIWVWEQ